MSKRILTAAALVLLALPHAAGQLGAVKAARSQGSDAFVPPAPAGPNGSLVPPCSALRNFTPRPISGPTEPYMKLMQEFRVRRATVDVEGVWQHGRVAKARPMGSPQYYRCYDCAFSEITDARRLSRLARSPLPAALGATAVARAQRALPMLPFDQRGFRLEGRRVTVAVILFDAEGAPGFAVYLPPIAMRAPTPSKLPSGPGALLAVLGYGDMLHLLCVLRTQNLAQRSLNMGLFARAESGPFDQAGAIEALVAHGANPNARGEGGETPLMSATVNPLNVQALLSLGADPWLRNDAGLTALDTLHRDERFVRQPVDQCSERLLTEAMARQSSGRE